METRHYTEELHLAENRLAVKIADAAKDNIPGDEWSLQDTSNPAEFQEVFVGSLNQCKEYLRGEGYSVA